MLYRAFNYGAPCTVSTPMNTRRCEMGNCPRALNIISSVGGGWVGGWGVIMFVGGNIPSLPALGAPSGAEAIVKNDINCYNNKQIFPKLKTQRE